MLGNSLVLIHYLWSQQQNNQQNQKIRLLDMFLEKINKFKEEYSNPWIKGAIKDKLNENS